MCGGLAFLGFWVYCDKDEIKEQKCQNMLVAILSKAKKYAKTKDPLILASFYSNSSNSLPEVWLRGDGNSLMKSKEQIKTYTASNKVVEISSQFPISLIYPLPEVSIESNPQSFRTILKQITDSFHEYLSNLKFTINSKISDGNDRIQTYDKDVL